MAEKCLFCNPEDVENHQVFVENELFYARWDNFPVSKGHSEIVSKKHIDSFFDLSEKELLQFFDLIKKAKEIILEKYHPDSFNIGVNDGEAAGRTIHHLHIHLIPRYLGDVENPRGGVRNIIPGEGNY